MTLVFVLCFGIFPPLPSAETESLEFTDVPKDKPYASAVYQLAERNLISGYDDGTFKPGTSITRGQAAAIISKLLNLDTKKVIDPGFKDVSPKLWGYKAISAVAAKGIFRGYSDGRFGPNDKITRAQMSSILIKAFQFHYYSYSSLNNPFTDIQKLASHQDSVHTLYKLGITSGTSPTTFSPNDPISRAQAAVLITKTETLRSSTVTLKSGDFGWEIFRGYEDYHNRLGAPEQNEEEIVQVIRNKISSRVLQIVPMKEGTQKLTLFGQKKDAPIGDFEYKKYYVHVSKVNGQLKMDFEETDVVFPTNARLSVKKDSIENISLAKMDGTIIDESINFQTCHEYTDFKSICVLLTDPGEYIATVEYENGAKVRYGIQVLLDPSDFYFSTYSIEEKPTVTVDLSKAKGDFSEVEISDEKIVKVTREVNSDIFHIQGLKEGNTFIDFPKSPRNKEGILGLNIRVQKIGSIIRVTATPYDYDDQFH